MTALVLQDAFFAPADRTGLIGLIEEHHAKRANLERVAALMTGETRQALGYFLTGNIDPSRQAKPNLDELFELAPAIAVLDADYWQKALELTDIFECFPEARRKEWREAIHERRTPPFNVDTVFPTIEDLLMARGKYFAERCDGLYRELSRSHKRNKPMGFSRLSIYAYVFQAGYTNHSRVGTIHDLRGVIAKFMGRDEPNWYATSNDLDRCMRRPGNWHSLDGGALHIRVYRGTGTAHIRLHDQIVERLNGVLASIYPNAIPARERTARDEKKKGASIEVLHRPLPFAVLQVVREAHISKAPAGPSVTLPYMEPAKRFLREQAEQILAQIGGVDVGNGEFRFDYDPADVLDGIVLSGCVPDERSHQFYPTPPEVAQAVMALAEVLPQHRCLEPSAGQGNLASLLPNPSKTILVELSALHCEVLKAKGFAPVHADFLDWAKTTPSRCDRIVMNPPFTAGQAAAHVRAAVGLLARGGRLVAVMPAGARDKVIVEGWRHTWSETIQGAFERTSVAVTLLTIERGD